MEHPADRGWRMPWPQLIACLVIFAGIGVILYPQIASWFAQREQSRVIELEQARMNEPPQNDPTRRSEELADARAYNEALASGAIFEANTNVATGDGASSDDSYVYEEILNATGTSFMGRLRYEDLAIDLPVYHGTSEDTLKRGVGHLEGTSLPVGGVGTRSVLTAHRGLPDATLFNDLDQAEVGDTFTVSVLDDVLAYEVVDVEVVEPDETQAILAVPDRDLVTLVTCTPLGINSHRILVTAERVEPTPIDDIEAASAVPDLPGFPWWAVILSATLLLLAGYVWRSGYDKPARKEETPPEAQAEENVLV